MKRLLLENASIAHNRRVILCDLNFTIEENDACALLGPNGSGKTSLMRCLLGLKRLHSGSLRSDFASVGYVPQASRQDRQFPLTVRRCVELSFRRGDFRSLFKRRERRNVDRALTTVGLANRADRLLYECSGGELQRTLIARALVHQPEFLALDEPTNSLDASGKEDLMRLLADLHRNENITLLMTTHETDPALLALFNARIVLANDGAQKTTETEGRG